MKRVWIVLMALLCACSIAAAEQQADEDALQAMLAAHADYTALSYVQWGDTAAAALGRGEERILCVAERVEGAWHVVVDNPSALPEGVQPSMLMDTDTALFWSYEDIASMHHYSYGSFRSNGVWNAPMCIRSDIMTEGMESYVEAEHRLEDGMLSFHISRRDENENLLSMRSVGPYPARWAEEYDTLAAYDDGAFPNAAHTCEESWMNWASLFRSAQEIAPEYVFIEGAATDNGLELLMEAEDGTLRMVTWSMVGGEGVMNISSPLPEGTQYNDMHAYIAMPDGVSASLGVYDDGVWHVQSVFTGGVTGIMLGRSWIAESVLYGSPFYVGDHPWNSLDIDWHTLPVTLSEGLAELDASRWAVVNNPNPADRLHLRERADRNARSNGKYYNGTPVEVLKRDGAWTRVRTPSGRTGWMMTEYLAFGEDAWRVANAFPQLGFAETAETFPVWETENVVMERPLAAEGDWIVERYEPVYVIGIVDNEWYHVWFPELDAGGCMRQSDFWSGNG